MKKYIILLGLVLLIGATAMAQWTKTGTTIHPTLITDRLAIGSTDASTARLYVLSDVAGQTAIQERVVNHAGGAALLMRKARGTVAARLAPINHDVIGGLFGQGWDGTAYRDVATVRFLADGNASSGSTPGRIVFETTPTGSITIAPRMTIRQNGFVGIGTINPQSLLSVNGKVSAKEVEVTMTGWSDFVFADDFSLRPLSEVEEFISANRHLPDVPSEAEVLQNGVNLGEMSSILLQKIEELTLYVIELNRKNVELQKRIDELAK